MTSLDELLAAEFKEAFDEFDKVSEDREYFEAQIQAIKSWYSPTTTTTPTTKQPNQLNKSEDNEYFEVELKAKKNISFFLLI